MNYASEEMKRKYLPKLATGEWLGAWGLTEANTGSDAMRMKCVAEQDGDYYIINGTKRFITTGKNAGLVIVTAKTDEAGFVSIFDGKTLDGWDGDPVYWRVEAGHLVGEITPKTVVKRNTFLIVYMDRQFLRQGTGPRNAAPPGARPDHKCPVSITPSTA